MNPADLEPQRHEKTKDKHCSDTEAPPPNLQFMERILPDMFSLLSDD